MHELAVTLLEQASDGGSVRDTVNSIEATNDQVMLALIALIGTSIAALVWVIRNGRIVRYGAEQASQANNAVNNVGPGKHTLYNMVETIAKDVESLKADQKEFDGHGWEHLPPDIGDAVALTTTIRDLQQTVSEHGQTQTEHSRILQTILDELRHHVTWEESTKYPPRDNDHP